MRLQWLDSLPYTISVPTLDTIVVHAGLVPGKPLGSQTPHEMTTMREVLSYPDGTFGTLQHDTGGSPTTPWAQLYRGEHGTVVFGHDARRGLQREEHAIGLDTGCVYGDELTALELPGGETVSVKAKKAYTPRTGVGL